MALDHAVVRTDKMFGTDNRNGIVSVRYQPSNTMTAIDNGNVVKLNGLETGSREIYKGATPAAGDAIKDVVLIASPEIIYDENVKGLDKFTNAAGEIARAYHFHTNDIFSVTAEALQGAPENVSQAVGKIVELQAGTKLKVVSSATANSTTIGKIIDVNTVGIYTYFVIEVA